MKKLGYRFVLGIAVVAVAVLSGCVGNAQYRTEYRSNPEGRSPTNCPDCVIEKTKDYTLGFVEFDDQGWLWNRAQIDTVVNELTEETKADGLLIITFVHGWQHNASSDDDNVQMMRGVLSQTAEIESLISKKQNRPPRRIVGVYVGWRGLSQTVIPFKLMTFWSRKNTAEVVGHGAVVELLTELEKLKTQSNENNAKEIDEHHRLSTRLIIIGHSFGGDIVYSATAPILTERMVENSDSNNVPSASKSLGDMVVLINPAFEAARFETLQRLAATRQFPSGSNCVLAIFTSKTDDATKIAFPAGRIVSTLFKSYRNHEQRMANITAVGHYAPYITYDLNTIDAKLKKSTSLVGTNEVRSSSSIDRILSVRAQRHQTQRTASMQDLTYTFTHCILEPRTNCIANDPIFVVAVDTKIIPNHGDIDNWIFRRFLGEFLFAFSNDEL